MQTVGALRVKSRVDSISALLVKNKIEGYFVGSSEASRSGFVKPRSSKEAEKQADPSEPHMTRAASSSAVEVKAGPPQDNPFAAFAFGTKKRPATEEKANRSQEEEAEAEASEPPLPREEAIERDEVVEEKEEALVGADEEVEEGGDDEWEDQYGDAVDDPSHSHLLTHAYSLALHSLPSPLPSLPPVLLPPESHSFHHTPARLPVSTFADPLPPQYLRSSTSPLPFSAEVELDDPSPSPSPSPPPPVTGPVFSKYFTSAQPQSLPPSPFPSSSPLPPSSPISSHRPLPPRPPPRDELLISSDDDVQIDSCSDKENSSPPPSSSPLPLPSEDVDDIEDVPSPPFRPTPSPPPFFSAKRSPHSLSPPRAIPSPVRRTNRPSFPLSAPTTSTGWKGVRGEGVGGEGRRERKRMRMGVGEEEEEEEGQGGRAGLNFFAQFRHQGGSPPRAPPPSAALPPPPLTSYAHTARQIRR